MELIREVGAFAGLAAFFGLAVLALLYFSQARDVRRLRENAEFLVEGEATAPEREVAEPVPAAVAAEEPGFIGPLMESLEHDLLPRDARAQETFGVRLHSFDAAVERSLREWEAFEEVRAR